MAWNDGVLEESRRRASPLLRSPAGFNANLLEIVGDELWAADLANCIVRKCTNDPKVAGSWSGPILVGNPSIPITAIRQTTNRLCIFKADGDVFTINGDGSDNDLFPGLQSTVDPDNARTASAWQGSLWFRTDRAFWRLDMQGGAVLTPKAQAARSSNLCEVRRPGAGVRGWNSQMAFGVIYNAALGNQLPADVRQLGAEPGRHGHQLQFCRPVGWVYRPLDRPQGHRAVGVQYPVRRTALHRLRRRWLRLDQTGAVPAHPRLGRRVHSDGRATSSPRCTTPCSRPTTSSSSAQRLRAVVPAGSRGRPELPPARLRGHAADHASVPPATSSAGTTPFTFNGQRQDLRSRSRATPSS